MQLFQAVMLYEPLRVPNPSNAHDSEWHLDIKTQLLFPWSHFYILYTYMSDGE